MAEKLAYKTCRETANFAAMIKLPQLTASVVIASIAGLALVAYATYRFGSPTGAVLAIRGFALHVQPSTVHLTSIVASSRHPLAFTIRNLRSRPVTVLGAHRSCSCSKLEGLPVTIAAQAKAEIRGSIFATPEDVGNPLMGSLLLYVDVPSPSIVIEIHCDEIVRPNT